MNDSKSGSEDDLLFEDNYDDDFGGSKNRKTPPKSLKKDKPSFDLGFADPLDKKSSDSEK